MVIIFISRRKYYNYSEYDVFQISAYIVCHVIVGSKLFSFASSS